MRVKRTSSTAEFDAECAADSLAQSSEVARGQAQIDRPEGVRTSRGNSVDRRPPLGEQFRLTRQPNLYLSNRRVRLVRDSYLAHDRDIVLLHRKIDARVTIDLEFDLRILRCARHDSPSIPPRRSGKCIACRLGPQIIA